MITKESIRHLAHLVRLELTEEEENRYIRDLEKILAHFKELESLDTSGVHGATGGTMVRNAFREDTLTHDSIRGAGVEAFPETKEGFLKIPPVFE